MGLANRQTLLQVTDCPDKFIFLTSWRESRAKILMSCLTDPFHLRSHTTYTHTHYRVENVHVHTSVHRDKQGSGRSQEKHQVGKMCILNLFFVFGVVILSFCFGKINIRSPRET